MVRHHCNTAVARSRLDESIAGAPIDEIADWPVGLVIEHRLSHAFDPRAKRALLSTALPIYWARELEA